MLYLKNKEHLQQSLTYTMFFNYWKYIINSDIGNHLISISWLSVYLIPFVCADDDSRTPSPSPSSGVESSSMKDSPMQIELGGDTTSIGEWTADSRTLFIQPSHI